MNIKRTSLSWRKGVPSGQELSDILVVVATLASERGYEGRIGDAMMLNRAADIIAYIRDRMEFGRGDLERDMARHWVFVEDREDG